MYVSAESPELPNHLCSEALELLGVKLRTVAKSHPTSWIIPTVPGVFKIITWKTTEPYFCGVGSFLVKLGLSTRKRV